jgi:uncharacterized protein YukE
MVNAMATRTSFERIEDAAVTCTSFNGRQQDRLDALQRTVARLQDNWRSARSAALFAQKWQQLQQAAAEMKSAMDSMVSGLERNRVFLSDASVAQAQLIDATPDVPSYSITQRH